MDGFSETQNSICFCRGGFEKLEASIFLHWMQLWVTQLVKCHTFFLKSSTEKCSSLPSFLPTDIRHLPCAKPMLEAQRWKKCSTCPEKLLSERKTAPHTNSYNSVDGWNGVCQMNKEKRSFSNESQQPVQGQGGIRAFPLLIQQVFFACLLWDTHCEWSRFESILWPEHVGGERWKMSLSYFCSSLMLMN